jgi:Tol biopolymer transport system component
MRKKIICLIITTILALVLNIFFNNSANAQYFGKNKTQYKNFDWKYIESTHFDIYYDAGSKALADFAAIALENALVSIQNTLNYQLTQRIPVVVYDSHNDFQQTNVINAYLGLGIGGVTELYKNRVVVPFQGNYSQLRHVLHHELVHAVINDMFYGGTIQTAISTNGAFAIPLWINEGLAEWESLGGMDVETDMFMRDLTINESLPKLTEIYGYLSYRAGQTFFHFIETKYGRGKITEFLNKLKIYKNLEITFLNTFGMELEEFSEMWQTEIKKIYWPDITVYQSPKDFATPLTNHEKDNCFYYSSPAISPNGEQMAFISDRDGGVFAVYVSNTTPEKDALGKEKDYKIRRLVSSARQQDFEQLNVLTPGISWSPDSKKIAISAKSGGEDAIFLIDAKNGKYEKILLGFSTITSVNWSPDGTKIAFVGIKNSASDIFYYDLENSELGNKNKNENQKVVNVTNDVFTDSYPIWSSDSKSIYFFSDRGDVFEQNEQNLSANNFKVWHHNYNQIDVFRMDLDFNNNSTDNSNNSNALVTKKLQKITNTPDIPKISMTVSADNQKMLLTANTNGITNIFEINITENLNNFAHASSVNSMKPFTNSASSISQISATPDGLNLIFSAQVKGGYDVFMLRNPYEKQFITDTLPLTNFAKQILQNDLISENNTKGENTNAENNEEVVDSLKSISYGDFETDFSNQQFLEPNQDAIEQVNFAPEETDNSQFENLKENDYEIDISLDAFLVNPGFSTFYGVQGAAAALFSDIMGNHQFMVSANLLNDLKNSQIYAAYMYNTNIIDYSFSLYNNSIYTWNYVEELENNFIYSYRSTGLVAGASYAFDLFKRFELNLNLVNAAKNNVEIPSYESINRFLVVPEARFVFDNTLNGIYAPTRGTRAYIKAMYSPKIADISSEFFTFVGDARQYFEIIPNWMSFALRGSAGISLGGNPQTFYIGGAENWLNSSFKTNNFQLENPEDFAFLNSFVMPLRGWDVLEQTGDKFAILNAEYRFPIFMAFAAGGLPIMIQGVMGNAFFDIGAAWTDDFRISNLDENGIRHPENLFMSSGWGIRAILLGLPFKFDMAWRNEYNGWSSPHYIFSLGFDF